MASWEHFNAFKSLQIRQRGREIPESGARSTANSHNTLPEENDQAGRSDDSSDSSDNASDGSSPDTTTSSSSSGARVLRNGERDPIQILELETANFIRDLFSQADLLSVEEPRENRRGPPLEIGYPYNSLLLIRQKLVHFAEQESTAAQLRYDIHSLLRLLLPTIWDTYESSIVGIDTIASQSAIIARGKVKFSELATLFLPGELVYSETIDASRELAYEQCCVVASCENESFRSRRAVRIRATKWVWCKRSLSISLSSSEVMTITEYPGEKNICVSKLGIVPLKVMSEDNMIQIRNRLIVRGKNYVETFHIEGSSWEYSGPISGSPGQSIIDLVSLKHAELGVWSTFNQFDATVRNAIAACIQ